MGGAYAASLAVPFFADAAGLWQSSNSSPAGPGAAGFIGLKNTTNSPVTVTVRYFMTTGSEVSPAANTFALTAQQGVSFRPAITDTLSEGNNAWSTINTTGGVTAGSATITWTPFGATTDVVGRYLEVNSNTGRSAYTLPAGS